MEQRILKLQTSLDPAKLRDRLKEWEPWSIRVDFSNGVSTKEFKQRTLFVENALFKFSIVESAVPFSELAGGDLLDIGCNAGYNSIHAAQKYGFSCTGVDVNPRHIEVARFFAELAGINARFLIGSAESFSYPNQFDVVLHLGTLYHLPNPFLALGVAFENLRPGGYLALETQLYDHPQDPNICYFLHMQNNDPTNFWALSSSVLRTSLELQGFREIREVVKVTSAPGLAEFMSRVVWVARKPT